MANREQLRIIRAARAGRVDAQLTLGKLYLFGSTGLPKSLLTALHWLDRAAQQECAEAWLLIGAHIPVELAQQSARLPTLWFERAYDAGVLRAGLVLAQLVLGGEPAAHPLRAKAMRALQEAARSGVPEAQWLLAQQPGLPTLEQDGAAPGQDALAAPAGPRTAAPPAPDDAPDGALEHEQWLFRAADNGVPEANYALLERAWEASQWDDFAERALPLARACVQAAAAQLRLPAPQEVVLLARCARLLAEDLVAHQVEPDLIRQFWELAANGNERHAQLALGLWFARMRADGSRTAVGAGSANFKKAIRWLTLAGEQGLAPAWYALSRIYIKPEFSQRNVGAAQGYLERAAEMGYREAQLECGSIAWRARREHEPNDVRAAYWLQKAAALGCQEASALLLKIAPRGAPALWGEPALSRELAASCPLLAARIELGTLFDLTRAEALLLDIKAADQGHCLLVDIRATYGRSKRRLVLLRTAQERHALDRIVRVFGDIECGPSGPEGNYRQRLYRFKRRLPGATLSAAARVAPGDQASQRMSRAAR